MSNARRVRIAQELQEMLKLRSAALRSNCQSCRNTARNQPTRHAVRPRICDDRCPLVACQIALGFTSLLKRFFDKIVNWRAADAGHPKLLSILLQVCSLCEFSSYLVMTKFVKLI